jgi:glycosyltransferase involved in cell wall biosynthesis
MTRWHLITGEHPPQPGGVSDYTRQLARGLAAAGDEVHVWAPSATAPTPTDEGVAVHRLPGHFGPRGLAALDAGLKRFGQPCRLLVQYVPHAFGWKAMNVPFCYWLSRRREPLWVMFHEVAFPMHRGQPLKHHVLGWVTRRMAALVVRSAERVFVSIPAWEPLLRSITGACPPVTWLPVPSSIVSTPSAELVARVRRQLLSDPTGLVVGHFGTYGSLQVPMLTEVLPTLLGKDARRVGLLLGRGGDQFADRLRQQHPSLRGRLVAPGGMAEVDLANQLAACDLFVQPYPDGASTRRSSLMAVLGLGLPIVTTTGALSEPLWRESDAVALAPADSTAAITAAAEDLLADRERRLRFGERARCLYHERFGIDRLVHTIRSAQAPELIPHPSGTRCDPVSLVPMAPVRS